MKPLSSSDPEFIGDFKLIGRIGTGGMGVVYLAVRGPERVALKLIHESLSADELTQSRFLREIQLLSTLDDPNVARMIDSGIFNDIAWFAAEYSNGPNLLEYVQDKGKLKEHDWWRLSFGLLGGLVAVHKAGIVYRDIKLANVILTDTGPKLIEFGIVTIEDATSLTHTGLISCSPAWFSPEQIEGKICG